jgi:NADPH:quinone reductase-like Zn-dependent oxidoreductase
VHHHLKTDRGLTARMKAIRICEYGGTGTLKLEEVPRISITNDQALVRIHDAGVNPADWKVRQGYLKQLRRKRCDKQVRK